MAPKSDSGSKLVIVESPAKAKTIKKFLGRGYSIKASMGHVRDLASKGKGASRFGVDVENEYRPVYVPIPGREKTLQELARAAEGAEAVYLAPDPDREGEAIAWHIAEALHLPREKTRRVTFNAITRREVSQAIEHPREIDMNLVNAQQARRVLDRLVGFSLSPLLWKKVAKGLSAGRVQSVAVRMVVEREREIQAFVPEEYWRIIAMLSEPAASDSERFQAFLVEWKGVRLWQGEKDWKGEKTGLRVEADARAVLDALAGAAYSVADLVERPSTTHPGPPFITSTLQQAASTSLGFGTQRTMRIAQQLYEGVEIDGSPVGLITYMRTDSVRIAPEAIHEAREYVTSAFPAGYLHEKDRVFRSKKGAQDAHEAIRPTSVALTPEKARPFLSPEQYRLYDLIWRRFVATQMAPARYLTTTATIRAGEGLFEAKGRKTLFDGHTRLYGAARPKPKKKEPAEGSEEEAEPEADASSADQELPLIAMGDALDCHHLDSLQKFTQPPPRYSEASLVRALEKEGIGRPSTYAPIVQTIQERGYVRLERRAFHATELGMGVTDLLLRGFPAIMDYRFTAQMEEDLDRVEEGTVDWVRMLDGFYKPFERQIEEAGDALEPLKNRPAPHGETCPACESPMTIRYSKNGAFLSCSRYPECKGTRPLDEAGGGEEDDLPPVDCPACGKPMQKKRSRFGVFLSCSGYPECKQILPLDRDGKPVELPKVEAVCELCGKKMLPKRGRRGVFLACTGYPECGNTKPIDKEGRIVELPKITGTCEKCGGPMKVRSSRRGPFLGCVAYPKCKNAKPIPEGAKDGEHIDFSALSANDPAVLETRPKSKSKPKAGAKVKVAAKAKPKAKAKVKRKKAVDPEEE